MDYFCTYFDRHYLVRGMAMYQSIKANGKPFTLWVLCLDEFTYDVLCKLNLAEIRPIPLQQIERGDERLSIAKQNRTKVEYYFTCSPCWPRYLLNSYPEINRLTYLDADLYFYSSPDSVFHELGGNSILVIPHRYPSHLLHLEVYGIYNVGLITIRNDEIGRACLDSWRDQCLEWCYDRLEEGRYADQKYLDQWPARFKRVAISERKGMGLAPWNWMNYHIQKRGGRWEIDGEPLVFFHFHSLKILNRWLYDPIANGRIFGEMPLALRWRIYKPYMRELKKTERWLKSVVPEVGLYRVESREKGYGWKGVLRKALSARLMFH